MTTAMVKQEDGAGLVRREFNRDEIDLIKRTVAVGATDAELKLFLYTCQRRGLDPLAKQIHFVKRKRKNYDSGQWEEYGVIQTGIDGFRLIAERTGRYDGQLGPLWCGEDGRWVDVWLAKEPPAAAKVGVLKRGWREPIWAVARWAAYVQTTSNGAPNTMWTKMGAEMLAKCAEVLALRKAFPEDLSGVYSNDEMMQADNTPVVAERVTGEIVEAEPPAPDFRAVYARQYAKAIDLGLSVVKDGYTLPPRLDGIGDDKARKMADWLSEQIRVYETPATEQAA